MVIASVRASDTAVDYSTTISVVMPELARAIFSHRIDRQLLICNPINSLSLLHLKYDFMSLRGIPLRVMAGFDLRKVYGDITTIKRLPEECTGSQKHVAGECSEFQYF
jgi:hypothetical protein